ncbi:T9SS type A sorting domain-containing protein [Mangrovimonas sp. YM274]|uniref:T9SS type A sorting domain-containing protein n=1 Tax=Mangrovimonas sp. YM274 TaxID=3070660 RepID=UPI0027DD0BC3|nr:T9SS type A sorting domain-containing protein [Mangrovimonas sp. YM274]WMI69187.1 T9SS type A sorting domain-containing protein [Mangrovimonas sp. YM274]
MKKVTLLFMLLCSLITYSQIEIITDFETGTNWTSDAYGWNVFNENVGYNAGCDNNSLQVLTEANQSWSTTSPTSVSNGTDVTVTFDYKVTNYDSPFAPVANWGSLVFEYTSDGGTTWTILETIDDSNYTYTEACTNFSTTIAGANVPDGNDFQFRATLNAITTSGGPWTSYLLAGIDNVAITQPATTVPNCDATLTSTTNIDAPAATISWDAATGLPTGYYVSVGDDSGNYNVTNNANVTNGTSLSLNNLQGETTYYVKITPYNAIGSSVDCPEQTFVTGPLPLLGDVCTYPIVVDTDAAPYTSSVDLYEYQDDYSTSPCNSSSSSIGGRDIVYAIAPFEDTSINISLTNIANRTTTVHVLDSCVDVAEYCIATAQSSTSNDYADINMTDIVLYANTVTYIVIASNSTLSPNSTFDLSITTNECIVPAVSLTTVPDCENYEFSVEVDITHFGNSSNLIVSDGVDEQELDAIGTLTFGPYATGSEVNITTTSDLGCAISDAVTYFCIPENNECSGALPLTASTDSTCDNKVSGYTYNATNSTNNSCSSSHKDVWYTFTPAESGYYQFTLTNTGTSTTGMKLSLYSGSCESLTEVSCDNEYLLTTTLTANTEYLVAVQSYGTDETGGEGVLFDLCAYQVPVIENNDCVDAIAVSESDADGSTNVISGSLENAFHSSIGCGGTDQRFAWYSFTPQNTGTYHINFNGSTSSTYFVLFNTDDCTDIDYNDFVPEIGSCWTFGGTAEMAFSLEAGTTYLAAVNGAGAYTYDFYIYPDASLSTAEVNFEGFRYYPNPVKNTLTFESPNMISSVAIYNVVGQKVLATADNDTMSTVNMGALPNGIYFAKVTIDGAEKTIKIIKE